MGKDLIREWIEVFNRGSESMELAANKIGDGETQGVSESIYHFFQDTKIDPGRVINIANGATYLVLADGSSPNFEFINRDLSVPDMGKYRDWVGGIPLMTSILI